MARYVMDCREMPSESNCTVVISADDKNEAVEAAAQHVVAVHAHNDSAELRKEMEKQLKTEPAM